MSGPGLKAGIGEASGAGQAHLGPCHTGSLNIFLTHSVRSREETPGAPLERVGRLAHTQTRQCCEPITRPAHPLYIGGRAHRCMGGGHFGAFPTCQDGIISVRPLKTSGFTTTKNSPLIPRVCQLQLALANVNTLYPHDVDESRTKPISESPGCSRFRSMFNASISEGLR